MEATTHTTQITSQPVYAWRSDVRRYHRNGQAIGSLHQPSDTQWTVRFTRPQPSGLPWTEFHTPVILAEYTFCAGSVEAADAFACHWLESQHDRLRFGDQIADVVDDFFALQAATRKS
jgi:hypothetical protein